MILSDLLGLTVIDDDGSEAGHVVDVRFSVETHEAVGSATLVGFLVSPHSRTSYLGFERSGVSQPWLLSALLGWRHRDSFLVLWRDIHMITESKVHLRRGFEKYDPKLPQRGFDGA
ncbi:PRC-barrel domain-containing protein [bacterium RCC_150]